MSQRLENLNAPLLLTQIAFCLLHSV